MAAKATPLQAVLEKDRGIVIACLAGIIFVSWAYLLAGVGMDMEMIAETAVKPMAPPMWDAGHAAVMLFMWWSMMIAMMLPSAAPMILLYSAINRRNSERSALAGTAFIAAYIVSWGAFSVIATGLQWELQRAGLLSSMLKSTNVVLGAGLLIAAGIWQLTPLKQACLRYCRLPIHFFAHRWRPGAGGAFRMGLEHGAFCIGCCWVLMALLFYGGVMNLTWIVGLAVYVLIEKLIPAGHRIGRSAGALLILWGGALLYSGS